MKSPTLKFIFDFKHKSNDKKPEQVHVQICYERKCKYIPTGIKLYPKQWDNEKHAIGRTDCMEINSQLDLVMRNVRKVIMSIQDDGEAFTFEKFDVYYKGVENSGSFLDFMYEKIRTRDIAPSTRNQHLVVYNLLQDDYKKIQSFRDLTPEMLKDFDDYIRTNGTEKCQATIYNIHKRLKPYVREAWEKGYIKNNPYDRFKVQQGKSKEREFLSLNEIEGIMEKELPDQLDKIRDLFIFGCFTGMAYSDICAFDYNRDTIEEDGKVYISSERIKTGESYYILMMEPVKEILKKYDYKLPTISLQRYNTHLKTMGALCGINKALTSHIARHTFACLALNNDMRIEAVSKALGHTNIKTTQIYAKLIKSTMNKEFDAFEKALKK